MGKKRVITKVEEVSLKSRDLKKISSNKIKEGKVYIFSSYNNTIITLTDLQGNVLTSVSAGSIGFKGTKKSTPFAASKVAEVFSDLCQKLGIEKINVLIKGIGAGRDSALRTLAGKGFDINSIKDITPIPHNGCRPPKPRRV